MPRLTKLLRVSQLENELKDKERIINESALEKRNLEKIKRDQEKQLQVYAMDNDHTSRVLKTPMIRS